VVGPNGLTDCEALRRRGSGDVAVLYAFDLWEYDGSDLRRMPLETRKATLASLLKQSGVIRLSEHIESRRDGPAARARGRGGTAKPGVNDPNRSSTRPVFVYWDRMERTVVCCGDRAAAKRKACMHAS
jgi:hypothetical protein